MEREATHREHAGEIQQLYGYRDFGSQPEFWQLLRWLYERVWLSVERPSVLFDLTTARLVEQKILLQERNNLDSSHFSGKGTS
jgi:Domain of unknown function (DUF4158)